VGSHPGRGCQSTDASGAAFARAGEAQLEGEIIAGEHGWSVRRPGGVCLPKRTDVRNEQPGRTVTRAVAVARTRLLPGLRGWTAEYAAIFGVPRLMPELAGSRRPRAALAAARRRCPFGGRRHRARYQTVVRRSGCRRAATRAMHTGNLAAPGAPWRVWERLFQSRLFFSQWTRPVGSGLRSNP